MSQPLFLLASRGLHSDRGRDPDLEQNIEADELQNRGHGMGRIRCSNTIGIFDETKCPLGHNEINEKWSKLNTCLEIQYTLLDYSSMHDYSNRKPTNQSTINIKLPLPAAEWRNVGIAGQQGGRCLAEFEVTEV
jgi:hypothetical protein